jgi:hypothetical protein
LTAARVCAVLIARWTAPREQDAAPTFADAKTTSHKLDDERPPPAQAGPPAAPSSRAFLAKATKLFRSHLGYEA